MKKAVVLLSGGLDSATCLYWSIRRGFKPFCLLFDYGQRHKKEVSICGDMVHNERYLDYLLGIGITRLSMDSRYIPKIQKAITLLNLAQAKKKTEKLLAQNRISETRKLLLE